VKTGHLIVPESYNPTSIRFAAYDEFLWRYEQYIGRAWRELRRARSKMTYYDSLHEEMHTLERRMSELKKQQTTLEEALRACETIYCADTSETEKTEPRERVVSVPRDRTKTEPADQTEAKPTDQTESKPDPFLEDADLSIEKKLKGPCYRGGTCRYDIVITNNGPGNYSGVLSFTDTPTLRPGWITIPSGNGACARDRGGASFTCTSNPVTLLPGHHWTTRLAIKLPRTNKRGVKNCAEVRDLDAVGPLDRDSGLVAAVQTALKRAGFNPGPADGQLGRKTRDALRQFQTSNGLGSESPGSKKVLDALLHINGRQADPNPQNNVSCVRTDFTQPFYDTSAPRKRPRRRKTEKGIDLSPALEIGIGIGMQMLRGRHHDSEGPPKD